MNVPKDKKENRKAELSKLYAKNFKLDEPTNFEGYRKLLGKRLYDVTYEKDYAVLKYRVSYENVKIEKNRCSHHKQILINRHHHRKIKKKK
ncbi:hypothetical protein ACT7C8_18085 [Bacillus cereus]